MNAVKQQLARAAVVLGLAFGLAACGGGGGSSAAGSSGGGSDAAEPLPTPTADVRNGTYTMLAADTREYSLTLDFDARTYQVTGEGVDQSGTFTAQADAFHFQFPGAVLPTGSSTRRFTIDSDTVVGEFFLPSGTVPFIAPSRFVNTLDAAAGTYNFLTRTVNIGGVASDTTLQQGEITASGQLRICGTILAISNCPSTSIIAGTITVSGNLFTATTSSESIPFRVAQVGSDKVFLRASPSTGITRRFTIGTPETTTVAGDTFVGGTTDPAWGTLTISETSFSSSATSPAGALIVRSGSVFPVEGIGGVRSIHAGTAGSFFLTRSANLGVMIASPGSISTAGFMAIGRKQ